MKINTIQKQGGVRPQGTARQLAPRQQRFLELYCDANSPTFGNCYQSAIAAGFSDMTARNLTHNKPSWYSEKLGQIKVMEPEDLLLKLSDIINNRSETTPNKLRAIDMLLKVNNMYRPTVQTFNQINIQNVLD